MGRSKRKRQQQEKKNRDDRGKKVPYEICPKYNADFEKYYKIQNICPDEEWESFLNAMKSELPTAFRITSSRSESKALLRVVEGTYFTDVINASQAEGDKCIIPICLPWYPNNLAWQLSLTRRNIRRSEAYIRLHNFLISETASGNISRQEVVSMIPPIALDVKSHHKVLDMCAAPGSKTAQIIEALHRDKEGIPEGFVVANDVDNNRCYMLVHQTKRLSSPNLIVINHDATVLPNLYFTNKDGQSETLLYDRILCDVPCTGDGTLRKNPDIWPKWNTANGSNLHGVQYRIVKRGCELLTIGGRLVYSTCSLNPIENEAVLVRLLNDTKDSLRLVDTSPLLPGLKCNPGMKSWTPASRDLQTYSDASEVPSMWQSSVRPSMFPPSKEEADKLHLEYCIRVLPHHQDTGGFFIAVIEKVKPLPWESAQKTDAGEKEPEPDIKPKEPSRKRRRTYCYKEDPYIFFESNEAVWPPIKEFYEINNSFPSNCLLTRCKVGKKKNIYFTSPFVREIVSQNAERVKIINTGVKVFARCDSKEMQCSFRLAQEGLWSIYDYIGDKRKVMVTKEDLLQLLNCEDLTKPPLRTSLCEEMQKRITEIGNGSCILVYNDEENSINFSMVGWIGSISTRAYIPQTDCIHYLRLLGGDTSKFEVNKFKKPAEDETMKDADEISKNGSESKDQAVDDGETIKAEKMEAAELS